MSGNNGSEDDTVDEAGQSVTAAVQLVTVIGVVL